MTAFDATDRPITVKIDGKGPYIAPSALVTEGVSEPFRMTAVIATSTLLAESTLGKVVNLFFDGPDESRQFNALLSSVELQDYSEDKASYFYQIEAIDPLSILAFRTNRRVFQSVTSKQILETIFSESGIKSYMKISVSGSGVTHEYCTQTGESDLDLVKRLMASEGWHYHLQHSGSNVLQAIGDTNQAFKSMSSDSLTYRTPEPDPLRMLKEFRQTQQLGSTSFSLADHSQEQAEKLESSEQKSSHKSAFSKLGQAFYGVGAADKSQIRDLAKRVGEADDVKKETYATESEIPLFSAGLTFKLTKHPVSALNQTYLAIHAEHSLAYQGAGHQVDYRCRVRAIPSSVTFKSPYLDKPRVHSVQSATVTGPKGDETYKDKDGRVKVQFHWDSEGKGDENTSCWLPVMQGAASNGFGFQFLPRIGDEVIVAFIDGDPDRPVVTGSIYNGKNKPPYSAATQSGIKTRSTPKGSSKNGNELRFEDQKDKEHVFLHAEKDFMLEVLNDLTETITGKSATKIEKTYELSSKEAYKATTEDKLTLDSKKDMSHSSDANLSLSAGSKGSFSASSSLSIDGQTVSISGNTKIELKVGGTKLELSASGVKISGPQVSINGSGKAELKGAMVTVEGSGKADVKGAMVTLDGSAMTQVKGGAMVQIQGAIAKVN
ncbi:type VI secretion system Vgr family protein [Thaumasiovibrio subtropicus]|uniref:type VI secretion system Vgr family protein n=1 Tax=Thaumasiovibrio subtropicus TaxID=1891207 RepID=UPI000B35D46D|nr:type VI secretion system tip protein TssI/VgrG [Thaumasiovibrio subtropicus]